MFTQFSEISSRFIHADKAKSVKRLLISPQYIEHKISTFNETSIQIKEQKNLLNRLGEVIHPFKIGLNTMGLPDFSLLGAHCHLIKVKYVKNAIFESNFEQFLHYSTV